MVLYHEDADKYKLPIYKQTCVSIMVEGIRDF